MDRRAPAGEPQLELHRSLRGVLQKVKHHVRERGEHVSKVFALRSRGAL